MPRPKFPRKEIIKWIERRYATLSKPSVHSGNARRLYQRQDGKFIPTGWAMSFYTWGVRGERITVFIPDQEL